MNGLSVPFNGKEVHMCQSPSPAILSLEEKDTATPSATRDLFDIHGDNGSLCDRNDGFVVQQQDQTVRTFSMNSQAQVDSLHLDRAMKFPAQYSTHCHDNPSSIPYQVPQATLSAVDIPMGWAAGNPSAPHPGEKPKRPLSAYNFFFQLERERIINGEYEDNDAIGIYTIEDVAKVALVQQRKAKENKPKEKRSHRKTHGKISFGDLARTIAHKWKRLDEKSKQMFEGSAAIEKDRYKKELAEWTKNHKKWKEATIKMTLSQHGVNSFANTSYRIVTPPQMPKKTVGYKDASVNHSDEIVRMSSIPFDSMNQNKVTRGQGMEEDEQLASLVAQQNHIMRMMMQGKRGSLDHERRFSTGMISPQSKIPSRSSLPQNNYGDGDNSFSYHNSQSQSNCYDYDTATEGAFAMAQMILPHNQSKLTEIGHTGMRQQTRNIQQQLQLKALMQQGLNSHNAGGMFSPQRGRIRQNAMGAASFDFDAALTNDTMHYGMNQLVSAYEQDSNAAYENYHKTFMLPTSGSQDLTNIRLTRKFDGKTRESVDDHDDFQPLNHKEFTPDELNHMHMLNVGFNDESMMNS